MNWEKKLAIGLSLSLEPYEYNELFRKYGKYIKEIYFAPVINDEVFILHSDIGEQFKEEEKMSDRTKQILDLAKEYGIETNMVLNVRLDADESIVRRALNWCKQWGVTINKMTVTDNVVVTAFVLSPLGCDLVSSFNNNLEFKDGKIIDDIRIDFYDEVVLGGRNLRNIDLIKFLKESDIRVEILINNGCSINCLYCSTMKSEFCEDIVDKNIEKNGLLYCMAVQSIYPSEIGIQYNKLGVDTYKISSRQFGSYIDFKQTLDLYINDRDPVNAEEFLLTCTLDRMRYHVTKHKFTSDDWKEIRKIKSELWKR